MLTVSAYSILVFILLCSVVSSCPIPFHIQSKCRCAITETGRVYIYCARKQLTVIPHFNNSNIIFDELVLSGNRISVVHKNAFTGLKLRKLELQSNPITQIESQAFVDLANYLEELILSTTASSTQLTAQTFVQILSELPNLKRLSLRSFNLSTFEHFLNKPNLLFRKLTQLSLQSCAMDGMDSIEIFRQIFPNLERLDLSENRFEKFDLSLLTSWRKLKILNLSKNKIRQFRQQTTLVTSTSSNSLIELDLSYNGIETIDEHAFESISEHLEILNLRNNELTTEKQLAFLIHMNRLREFYLDYNRLENLNQVSLPLNLKVLSLKNNQLNQLDLSILTRLEQLEKVFLSANKVNKIVPSSKNVFPSLEILEFDRNQLTFLPSFNAPKLKQLNLDGNFFGRKLDRKIFTNMPSLERLHLRDNQIDAIEPQAFRNTRLQSIDLRNNSLQTIPQWMKIDETLQILLLRRNQICTVEKEVLRHYSNLTTLELDQNPLHCDCRMSKNFHPTKVTGQCESPAERRGVDLNELPDDPFSCSLFTMPQCNYLVKTMLEYEEEKKTTTTTTTTTSTTTTTTAPTTTTLSSTTTNVQTLVDRLGARQDSSSLITTIAQRPVIDIIRIADFTVTPSFDKNQLFIQWQLYPSTFDIIANDDHRRADLKRHGITGFKISSTYPRFQMSELLDVLQRNYTLDLVQQGEVCLYLLRSENYEKFCKKLQITSTETMKSSLVSDSNLSQAWLNTEPTKSILIGSLLGILLVLILLTCVIIILTRCPSVFFCHLRSSKYHHQGNDSKSESLLVRPTPTNTILWQSQQKSMPFYPHLHPHAHSLRPTSYQASLSTQCTCPTQYHSSGSSSTGTGSSCPHGQNYHIYQEIPNEDFQNQAHCHPYRTYRPIKVETSSSPPTSSSAQTTTTTSSEQCQLCSLSVLV